MKNQRMTVPMVVDVVTSVEGDPDTRAVIASATFTVEGERADEIQTRYCREVAKALRDLADQLDNSTWRECDE